MKNKPAAGVAGKAVSYVTMRVVPYFKTHYRSMRNISDVVLICLLAALAVYFWRPVADAFKLSVTAGWGFFLLPLLFMIWNTFATAGWYTLVNVSSQNCKPRFWYLYILRIQSQALNLVLPVSGIGGEALRTVKTRDVNGIKSSARAVVIDKVLDVTSDMVLAFAGIAIACTCFAFPKMVFAAAITICAVLLCGVCFWQLIASWIIQKTKWEKLAGKMGALLHDKNTAKASRESFAWHFVEHLFMAVEIYVVAKMVGVTLGVQDVLYCNAVAALFNILFILVPGRIGAFECSLAYAFSQIGLASSAGISVALIRRARQVLICIIGLLSLTIKGRRSAEYKNQTQSSLEMPASPLCSCKDVCQ